MPRLLLLALVAGCTAVHAIVAIGVADLLNEPGAAAHASPGPTVRALRVRSVEPPPTDPDKIDDRATAVADASVPAPPSPAVTASSKTGVRRYFDAAEVDTPAAPQPDWQVDIDRMIAAGVHRVNFEILVNEFGVAERCRITLMEPPQSLPPSQVAARLCTTRMTPAMRGGAPVPSVRRIELLLAE
jgi:hypothetical protein